MGQWIRPQFHNLRFSDAVPVFQRGVEISLEKIDGSEKVVRIAVLRGQLEGLPQETSGTRIVLLLECHPRQLDREPRIVGCEAESGLKGARGLTPTLQSRQRGPVIEIQVG